MLNCEEFVTMSVHLKKIGDGDEQLRQAFQYFDRDGSGFIEIEELKQGLLDDNLGPNNDKVIQDIIFDVDLDKVNKHNTRSYFVDQLFFGFNNSNQHFEGFCIFF